MPAQTDFLGTLGRGGMHGLDPTNDQAGFASIDNVVVAPVWLRAIHLIGT